MFVISAEKKDNTNYLIFPTAKCLGNGQTFSWINGVFHYEAFR